MAGSWTCTSTLTFVGGGSVYGPGAIIVTVSGNAVSVAPICFGSAYGSVTATGSGDSVSWSGTIECPPVPIPNCDSTYLTYTDVTVTLDTSCNLAATSSRLEVDAKGTGVACAVTDAIVVGFGCVICPNGSC